MEIISFYDWLIVATFVIGYFLITIEHIIHVNKTSIALLMAILCWTFLFIDEGRLPETNLHSLGEHMSSISQVVFFLLSALTIVEIIAAHRGFQLISKYIQVRSKRTLLWVVGLIAFCLSAVLDNLTTTIIMITLVRRLLDKGEDRLLIGGAVVIAANAGGAWTPIGDVTTTMLWIGGQLSTFAIISKLFIPSLVCVLVALFLLGWSFKGEYNPQQFNDGSQRIEPKGQLIFWLGVGCLIFVPIFKLLTGLPPFMGIIFGLAIMWLVTDIMHSQHEDRYHLRVPNIMTKIDVSGVLFFLGILLCIDALNTAGLLNALADWMNRYIANTRLIAISLGLASAIVDNVPLVAAAMGMYDLSVYPTDSSFWNLVAYCAGTGGSILVIGSAAGVAFMGMERVEFFWYLRRVGIPALIGYLAGVLLVP